MGGGGGRGALRINSLITVLSTTWNGDSMTVFLESRCSFNSRQQGN